MTNDPSKWPKRIHRALNDEQAKIWAADRELARITSRHVRKSLREQISQARYRIAFLVMLAQSAVAGPPSPPGLTNLSELPSNIPKNIPPLPTFAPVYTFTATNWWATNWDEGIEDPTNHAILHQVGQLFLISGAVSTNPGYSFTNATMTNWVPTNEPPQRDVYVGAKVVERHWSKFKPSKQ
jgi:hypothetical protein